MKPETEVTTRIGRINTLQAEEAEAPKEYEVQLIPLNEMTDDGRIFEELEWREPPLAFMATKKTSFAHEGATFVGNLVDFKKKTFDNTEWVVARVEWDEGDEEALDFKRLVDEGKMKTVSGDVQILDAEMDVTYDEDGFIEDMKLIVHLGKIIGATMVPMPAFEHAGFTASAADDDWLPPAAWFDDPKLTRLTPITMDGDRVYGHLAPWNECHIGIKNACVVAPRSASEYSLFLSGELEVDNGEMVNVGQITLSGGHADHSRTARQALAHYDDTKSAVADVTVGEDDHGIWFSGAVRPTASDIQRKMLRASGKLSGDWRPYKGSHELVAMLCVNSPGYPQVRTLVASGKQTALFLTGMVPSREEQLEHTIHRMEELADRMERRELVAEAERLAAV